MEEPAPGQLRPHVTEDRGNLGPNILIDPQRAFWHTSACRVLCRDFRSLHFTYLLDGCLYDDDLPIANLEPGVSGRNSLPLTGTPGPPALIKPGLFDIIKHGKIKPLANIFDFLKK